jgi:hypothetical protein
MVSVRYFVTVMESCDSDQYITATAGCWWLMPVIIATWKAEIRRISVMRPS